MSAAVAAQPIAKKSTKAKKAPANHPPYSEMIRSAVKDLKERQGSSRQAITKYIKAHYKVDEKAENHIRRALVVAVKSGKLVHTKGIGASGSFKLTEKVVKPKVVVPKPKKVKTPKKAVVKKVKATTAKPAAAKKAKTVKPKPTKPKKAKTPKKPKTLKPKKPIAKKTPKKAVSKK
ncbi:Histone H1-delta [Fasciola gigantica]|uniref:Histone H1-delta n=1 Tax=Fasciola gigantica TaxID=46835 RepID=A0A504YG95_FASGI|nr:Histone H1-delta [Fasciola gigantica]